MTGSQESSTVGVMFGLVVAMLGAALSAFRSRSSLVAENLAVQQQLAVLRAGRRPRLRPVDRAFWVVLSRVWSRWPDERPGRRLARIPVRAGLAAALEIRWARQDAALSQAELGKRAGVKQQQIAKIENPDENRTLQTIEKVAKALGLTVSLGLEDAVRISVPPPRLTARRA